MKEKWKEIKGYENHYEVSNFGRIKSIKKSKEIVMKLCNCNGYKIIRLYKKGGKMFYVHRLVAENFITSNNNGLVVDHIDGDKTNNNVDNLQFITQRYNCLKSDWKNKSSKYVGVSYHKEHKKWYSRILIDGERKYLGSFDTEAKAHKTYQIELSKIKK